MINPAVPGNTELGRFDNAARKMFAVSEEDVLKEQAKWQRAKKKRAKEPA